MGHSTDVPIEKRISVWIETVPRILEHLNVKHVALVSHSFGTVYLLNTLYHYRHLLHPEKPFIAVFGMLQITNDIQSRPREVVLLIRYSPLG